MEKKIKYQIVNLVQIESTDEPVFDGSRISFGNTTLNHDFKVSQMFEIDSSYLWLFGLWYKDGKTLIHTSCSPFLSQDVRREPLVHSIRVDLNECLIYPDYQEYHDLFCHTEKGVKYVFALNKNVAPANRTNAKRSDDSVLELSWLFLPPRSRPYEVGQVES